ncbi:MAG: hypothetical protein IJF32_07430, partial [Oscillospiraceae bacterium]|nr:hypothetical protein [Oscillospiraceae bacterium]
IAARALESLDEHSKDEDAHGIGEKINEIEERIRKLSITGGGNGVPVISVHDELYAEIVPEEGQVYVVKYHDMPYGEDPNLISDAVFYRVKIGDGVRTLAELPVMTNIEAGTGNGSIRLVDPTYDNGDDGIDSPNNIAAGQFSVSLGKYIKNYGKAAAGFGYSNDITENGRRSFVAGANILMDAEVSAAIGFRNSLYGSKHFGWGSYLTLRGGGNIAAGKAIETTDESSNTVLLGANLETALPHKGENQVIYGQYNEEDADALVILGGGTSDTERKNALVVKKDGTILIDGKEFDKIAPFLEAIEKELSAGGLIPKYVYLKPDGSFGFEEMPGEDKTLPEYKFLQGGHSDVTNAAPSNYTEYPAEGSDSDRQWAYLGTTAKKSNSSGNFTSFGSSYAWMIGSSYDTWTAFRIRIPETGFYSVNMDYMKFTNGGIIETYILPMTAEMETEFAPENTDTYGTTASNGTGNYQERTGGKTFLQLTSIAGAKPIGDAIDTYGAESRGEWFYDEKIGEVSAEAGEYLLLFRNTRATSKGNLRFANITLTGFVPAADAIKVGETVLT